MNVFYKLLLYFQKRGFEVCGRIAERLGIGQEWLELLLFI